MNPLTPPLAAPPCSASLDVADCCISLEEARDVIRRREKYTNSRVRLENAARKARPWIKHFERMLASSLSCDSRSHDNDREPRADICDLLDAIDALDKPNDQGQLRRK
jgi:hypothetical protein